MKLEEINVIHGIPDYQYFLTLEEFDASSQRLAEKYPDTVKLMQIGTSRGGRPLLCLKIGDGPRNALLMGCPHPNEPIGSMLLEYFSAELAGDEKLRRAYPYTWYIIKVWDVDGYYLNEGWLRGPFTITNYARHMFRPAGWEQVDWNFPVDYKELHFHTSVPETLAVKELIDRIKPQFIYSLHNSGFGGAYWYMTEPLREVFSDLRKVPGKNGVPLSLGLPESPYAKVFGEAIFGSLGVIGEYDYLEKYGAAEAAKNIRCGDTSASYARRHYHSFTLLTELPYFYDPRIEDQSPGTISRKEGMLRRNAENGAMSRELREILAISRPYLKETNPFMRAVESFTAYRGNKDMALHGMMEDDPKYCEPATVAEELDMLYISKFYKLVSYGMLARANETALEELEQQEHPNKEARSALLRGLEKAEAAFQRIAAFLEENLHYSMVPIKNMIAVQLESGLLVLEELERRSDISCGEERA